MKIYQLKSDVMSAVSGDKAYTCVDIFAYAKGDGEGTVTIGCELGEDEKMCVYDGVVNTEDPGEGPMEEYNNREDALVSKYGSMFKVLFNLGDNLK